jgi:hypothetical protein
MIGRHPLRGVYETRQFHFSKGIALRLFGVSLGLAQHNHQDVRNNKSAELLEGLGKQTHPIRASSPEAQKFFDQSLALVFGFNHDEAARLFAYEPSAVAIVEPRVNLPRGLWKSLITRTGTTP